MSVRKSGRKKSRLYHENTIIVVPKFMHRIRSNAKSLILLILLTAGTLAVFGSTVLSMWYPYQSFRRIIPSAIEYRVTNEQEKGNLFAGFTGRLATNRNTKFMKRLFSK